MSKTVDRPPRSHPELPEVLPVAAAEPSGAWETVKWVLTPIASLRLTVVLMALSILIVFFGTLAQVDHGIFTVLQNYFRTWLAWIPFQVFVQFGQVFLSVPKETHVSGSFPFPGGWLLGGLLLVNLLAAHLVRFKLTWKRSGILLIHSGLVVMMLSELITGLFAVEARMPIGIGETTNYVDVANTCELAFVRSVNEQTDDVTVIPGSLLAKGGRISDASLPVDVEVAAYLKNSDLLEHSRGEAPADAVPRNDGWFFTVAPAGEGNGFSDKDDSPAVRVRLLKKDTSDVVGYFGLSTLFEPNAFGRHYLFAEQHFTVDGKTYTIALRPQREYKPYAVTLKEFTHEVYPGTTKPKNYESTVRLVDASRGEDRDAVKIYMNNPMRYAGETFYQAGFFPDDSGTILQVVRNPGNFAPSAAPQWLAGYMTMPVLSCLMVSLGMVVHFGLHLLGFLRRRYA